MDEIRPNIFRNGEGWTQDERTRLELYLDGEVALHGLFMAVTRTLTPVDVHDRALKISEHESMRTVQRVFEPVQLPPDPARPRQRRGRRVELSDTTTIVSSRLPADSGGVDTTLLSTEWYCRLKAVGGGDKPQINTRPSLVKWQQPEEHLPPARLRPIPKSVGHWVFVNWREVRAIISDEQRSEQVDEQLAAAELLRKVQDVLRKGERQSPPNRY